MFSLFVKVKDLSFYIWFVQIIENNFLFTSDSSVIVVGFRRKRTNGEKTNATIVKTHINQRNPRACTAKPANSGPLQK